MADKPKPDDAPPKTAEKQPLTHEELVAAAISELVEEGHKDRDKDGPPDWFQKVYNNT